MWWFAVVASLAAEPVIVERPLPFSAERLALSVQYLAEHSELHQATPDTQPRVIVLHWTGISSLSASWNTFESPVLSGRSELQGASALNVSAHYLVDRDGTVYRLMPDTVMARHCIGLNHISIGIENVGGDQPLTEAQVQANIALIEQLAQKFPITHVIGHSEYRAFEGHPYFRERDPHYRTVKPDPGAEFLVQVRAGLQHLSLSGPPVQDPPR